MPAGDLLPTEGELYAAEVNELLLAPYKGFGDADWWITELTGFGDTAVKDQDVAFDGLDGGLAGPDYLTETALVFTVACNAGTASAGEAAYRTLRAAFLPGPDVELHLWAPDWGHIYLTGRTRGSVPKRVHMAKGILFAQATFIALDPTITEVPAP